VSSIADRRARGAPHVVWLWSLTTLFAFRVLAQLAQYATPSRFLPPFDAWQGSGLSYPVLLASQLLILAVMILATRGVSRRARASRRVGGWLIAIGCVYLASMSARLVLGLTMLADVPWFAKPLPALFHMVLAGYVLTLGHYHWAGDERSSEEAVSPTPISPDGD